LKKYLKLTAGTFKGRRLYVPDSGVRPATNLVREAIFSILKNMFEEGIKDVHILDLFAGTGSLGLESLSRGAEKATFVDNDNFSVGSIKKNLKFLNLKGEVIRSDVVSFLKRNKKKLNYDVVFFDPPYKYEMVEEALILVGQSVIPSKSVILVYERSYKKELPRLNLDFELSKRKKYGQTEVLYYKIESKIGV